MSVCIKPVEKTDHEKEQDVGSKWIAAICPVNIALPSENKPCLMFVIFLSNMNSL